MNTTNLLYYGDNLDILHRYIKDETVDLIYLDPPFNSNQDYNVLFAEQDGSRSAAQIKAFGDTWGWDQESARTYLKMVDAGGKVSQVMQAFHTFLGENDMLAYLSMMAPRLVDLRRVLRPSGSIYLHCDPTASHYLKLLMDAVFGPQNFRNEIVWRRSHPKGHAFTRFATSHDVILAYAMGTKTATWNPIYAANMNADEQYRLVDDQGRRYQLTSLLNPNPDRPNLTYSFKGVTKVWRWTRERMEEADRQGLIIVPKGGEGIPRLKRYLDEQEGIPVGDFWDDIPIAAGGERLGYPTQKPEALLERIIQASSNEGEVVLDPFCGCGTTIAVAQRLNRQWIGIDITHLAITLIKNRLKDMTNGRASYTIIGEPVTLPDAEELAANDKYQFQWWALGLVGARPADQKKGADKGIDGRLYFHDEADETKTKQVILSVKGGKLKPDDVRALKGVVQRESAQIGVLISFEEPTKPMRADAAGGGFYHSPGWDKDYPAIQIITVEELLNGKSIDMPPQQQVSTTFKKAPRAKGPKGKNLAMPLDG
ncbi:MAG: DNA methyltransferase [Dehalococcoidia bacterium]|nr:DNA methyltransferase [Dehalococcoidia bacterium]